MVEKNKKKYFEKKGFNSIQSGRSSKLSNSSYDATFFRSQNETQ